MIFDKVFIVYDGFPPDDDWIDSIWDNRESAIKILDVIRKIEPNHGYMEVYKLNERNAEIETEGIAYNLERK